MPNLAKIFIYLWAFIYLFIVISLLLTLEKNSLLHKLVYGNGMEGVDIDFLCARLDYTHSVIRKRVKGDHVN